MTDSARIIAPILAKIRIERECGPAAWGMFAYDDRHELTVAAYEDISALKAAGWAVVPVEPTADMVFTGGFIRLDHVKAIKSTGEITVGSENAARIYETMLKEAGK